MKKYNFKIRILPFSCLLVFAMGNFISIILAQDTTINFRRYSIGSPAGDWKISLRDKDKQRVVFEKKTKKENLYIWISYVPVFNPSLWKLSEEELAKDYIATQKHSLEKDELYKLTNVVEGTDNINGRKFYTMSYQNIGTKGLYKGYMVDGLFYVYIPAAEQHKELFMFLFTNGPYYPRNNKLPASSLEEFIKVLKSLDIK